MDIKLIIWGPQKMIWGPHKIIWGTPLGVPTPTLGTPDLQNTKKGKAARNVVSIIIRIVSVSW